MRTYRKMKKNGSPGRSMWFKKVQQRLLWFKWNQMTCLECLRLFTCWCTCENIWTVVQGELQCSANDLSLRLNYIWDVGPARFKIPNRIRLCLKPGGCISRNYAGSDKSAPNNMLIYFSKECQLLACDKNTSWQDAPEAAVCPDSLCFIHNNSTHFSFVL